MGTDGKRKSLATTAGVLRLLLLISALALAACGGSSTAPTSSPTFAPAEAVVVPSATWTPTPAAPVPKNGAPFAQVARLFAYDASDPIGLNDTGTWEYKPADGAPRTIRMMTYLSAGKPVEAWLVLPEGEGPFPAVMYLPGYGGVIDEWVPYACQLADRGYAGLLIAPTDERSDCPRYTLLSWNGKQDVAAMAQYVVDLRRGIDLLQSLPQIDGRRIGFVGHSYGGTVGGILAGVEDRIKAYVLVSAGGGSWRQDVPMNQEMRDYHTARGNPPPSDAAIARWNRQVAIIAPFNFIGHNQGAAFLILNSTGDFPPSGHVARAAICRCAAATTQPVTVRFYRGSHDPNAAAYRIATRFLREKL